MAGEGERKKEYLQCYYGMAVKEVGASQVVHTM